jgi:soluble lytic murein transglycosylase-like protein
MRHRFVSFVSFALMFLSCVPASAELLYFSNGRTMSVKSFRIEGTTLVLSLRSGGEISCETSVIARIEPDEVPYPETEQPDPALTAIEPRRAAALTPAPELQTNPRYEAMIQQASARHGVDPTLVRAVIQVESNYEPRARSSKGARGLMQLMPSTARQYGVSNLYDPAANIEGGIRYLKSLLSRLPLELALAAYNAGETAVQRFGGIPPFAETRNYVDRILKLVGRTQA